MIIVVHDVNEGCRDTDIYPIDTSKMQAGKLKQRLEAAKNNDWIEIQDSEAFEDEIKLAKLPAKVQKVLTIYFE